MRWLWSFIVFIVMTTAWGNNELNVYTWGNYIPDAVINQFERETGIDVKLSEFDSNAMLYTKLKSLPQGYYDIVMPSSNYLQRMAREGMLRKLNHQALPNMKHLDPRFIHLKYDPHNDYSIPYLWGTTGIVVNDRYHNPQSITDWSDFWEPQYHHGLLLLDDMQEVFAIALARLGYSLNATDPEHIERAFQLLQKLRPNIKLFKGDAAHVIYMDEDATIGMGWSGDIYLAQRYNPHLHYIYPKSKFPLWIDCLAIPRDAPHPDNAHKFINFILRPQIAKAISVDQGYSTPNKDALPYLPKAMRQSPIINPSKTTLKRARIQKDLGSARMLYGKYWEQLKLGL